MRICMYIYIYQSQLTNLTVRSLYNSFLSFDEYYHLYHVKGLPYDKKHSRNVALIHGTLERRSFNYVTYMEQQIKVELYINPIITWPQFSTLLLTVHQWLIYKDTTQRIAGDPRSVDRECSAEKCNRPDLNGIGIWSKEGLWKWVYGNQ